jgi:uncharacterized membrane protein YheB (UPF0754 family)
MELFWIAPVAGALVGWLTNIVAIEMLFRPKYPLYLFGKRLPLTPGLVPLNKKKIANIAADNISSVVFDSLKSDKPDSSQLELFNTLLDSHWSSYIFIGPHKRERMYRKLCDGIYTNSKTKDLLKTIIKDQMMRYDIEHFEKTVRALSNDSLKGIKIVGALLGAIIGSFSILV